MKKLFLVAASVASLSFGMPLAHSADLTPEPVIDWTGLYLGVGGGLNYNSYDAKSEYIDSDGELFISEDLDRWNGFATIGIGYDLAFSQSFLVGLMASADFGGKNKADKTSSQENGISSIEASLSDAYFVGGRFGYLVDEPFLLYLLGGYTWTKGKVEARHDPDFAVPLTFRGKEDVGGPTVGAGFEYLLSELFSVKLEYRHDFLDSIEWDEEGEFGAQQSGKVDFDRDTVRAVFSIRFNTGS